MRLGASPTGPDILLTLQRVAGEAQLADDVAWDVRLDALALFGMALCCLQKVIKLLRVKLLPWVGGEKDSVTGRNPGAHCAWGTTDGQAYQALEEPCRPRDDNEDLLHQLLDKGHLPTFRALRGLNGTRGNK